MRPAAEKRSAQQVWVVLPAVIALSLTGCAVGVEGTLSPDSLTCQAAQSLFDGSEAHDNDEAIERLAAGVPKEVRSAVERLADYPESADEWQSYDADLAWVQQWAVTSCGATVAFPVELDDTTPRLEDYVSSVSHDASATAVRISGAPGLDSAVELCELALVKHAEPGHPIDVEVRDSFGILLALGDADGCVVNPEFTG